VLCGAQPRGRAGFGGREGCGAKESLVGLGDGMLTIGKVLGLICCLVLHVGKIK
jgi:hypothetical protein